jgi:hypothetical protein
MEQMIIDPKKLRQLEEQSNKYANLLASHKLKCYKYQAKIAKVFEQIQTEELKKQPTF